MVILLLVFKEISILFSILAALIYIPTNDVGGFPSLHTLSAFAIGRPLMMAIQMGVKWYLIVVLISISLTILSIDSSGRQNLSQSYSSGYLQVHIL